MKIQLSVTYKDLQELINYITTLVIQINKVASNQKATAYQIAEAKANLSELLYLQSRFNLKSLSWPINRQQNKITKKVSVSYTQGRILWLNYDVHKHSVYINDKIQTIVKELVQ